MVPVTIMPLAGAGAVAPKGDSNSRGRPRPWPVPNTFLLRCAICALSNVAMGLSGKMVAITLAYVPMNAKRLPFARRKMRTRNLLKATPGTPFQVGHSKTLKANKRRSHIEIELVRLRPTTHSKEPTCFIHPAPPRGRAARRCPLAAAAAWALKSRLYSLRIASASPRSQARTKYIISSDASLPPWLYTLHFW